MGRITSLFARKVVRAAGKAVDEAALLQSIGLSPDGATDMTQMLDDAAYYDLLERVARAMDLHEAGSGASLPLLAGASMRCDDYGAFGLAFKAAPNLRGSFANSERFALILSNVSAYEVTPHPDGGWMHLHRAGERRLGLRLSNEATLASIVSIIREVSPAPFAPLEVHLKHPAPASLAAHEAYFGAPLIFGSEFDALLISSEALGRNNRLGDAGIEGFLHQHLEEELAQIQRTEPALERSVRDAIARALSEGAPKMGRIARRLGMSERTLHRRLAEDGLAFQSLVVETRRELAEGLLTKTDYSLAEIAFLTGFSEQSAFTRAFRRWVDQTPAAYRDSRRSA